MKTPDVVKINKGLKCCKNADCDPCPYYSYHGTIAECLTALASDTMAYITQLEQRLASAGKTCPEWISVEDRLPTESDGTVLVCFPDVFPYNSKEHCVNAKHDQRVRTAKYSQFSNEWYIGDMAGISKVRPTHWMPIPEPPKEE